MFLCLQNQTSIIIDRKNIVYLFIWVAFWISVPLHRFFFAHFLLMLYAHKQTNMTTRPSRTQCVTVSSNICSIAMHPIKGLLFMTTHLAWEFLVHIKEINFIPKHRLLFLQKIFFRSAVHLHQWIIIIC